MTVCTAVEVWVVLVALVRRQPGLFLVPGRAPGSTWHCRLYHNSIFSVTSFIVAVPLGCHPHGGVAETRRTSGGVEYRLTISNGFGVGFAAVMVAGCSINDFSLE